MGIAPVVFVSCTLAFGSLTGCAGEDAEATAPQSPSPANSATNVVQNISYTTNVYGPASIVTSKSADGGSVASSNDEANVVVVSPAGVPSSPEDADGPTGIAECDAYLARVSTCTHHMLAHVQGAGDAAKRIDDGLASARRAWRKVALLHPELRSVLGRQCVDAESTFETSMKSRCDE